MIEWKRYRACEKCRKSKTRCEYEGPYDKKCKRCSRLNLECIQKEPKRSLPLHAKTIGIQKSYAKSPNHGDYKIEAVKEPYIPGSSVTNDAASGLSKTREYEPNSSESQAVARNGSPNDETYAMNDMSNSTNKSVYGSVRRTASADGRSTISSGSPCSGVTSMSSGLCEFSIETLTLRQLHRPDCLNLAIELGLFTSESAALFFDLYMAGMNESANLGISDTASIDVMVKEQPLLALTIITVCAVCSTLDKAEQRAQFCKRIIFETIFGRRQTSLETLQCLLVCEQFMLVIKSKVEGEDAPFMGNTADLCSTLNLMSNVLEDIEKTEGMEDRLSYVSGFVISTNGTDVTKRYPLKTKIKILSCTECLTAGMGFVFGAKIKDLSDDWKSIMTFCIAICDPSLVLCSCLVKLMVKFSSVTYRLLRLPVDDVDTAIVHHKALVAACNEIEELSSSILTRTLSIPLALYKLTVMKVKLTRISAHELIMSRFLANKIQMNGDLPWPSTLAVEIRHVCLEVLKEISEMTAKSTRYPRYVFIRPVQALAMLARLHLLSYVSPEISFDVAELDEALTTAEKTYKRLIKTSILVRYMYNDRLLPVMEWIRNMVDAEKLQGRRPPSQKMPPDHLVPPAVQYVLSNINLSQYKSAPGSKYGMMKEEDSSTKKLKLLNDNNEELTIDNDEPLSNFEVDQIMQDLFKIAPLEYFPS